MLEPAILSMARLAMLLTLAESSQLIDVAETVRAKMNERMNDPAFSSLNRRFSQLLEVLDNPNVYASLCAPEDHLSVCQFLFT